MKAILLAVVGMQSCVWQMTSTGLAAPEVAAAGPHQTSGPSPSDPMRSITSVMVSQLSLGGDQWTPEEVIVSTEPVFEYLSVLSKYESVPLTGVLAERRAEIEAICRGRTTISDDVVLFTRDTGWKHRTVDGQIQRYMSVDCWAS